MVRELSHPPRGDNKVKLKYLDFQRCIVTIVSLFSLAACAAWQSETPLEVLSRLERANTRVRTLVMVAKTTVQTPTITRIATEERWEHRDGDLFKIRAEVTGSVIRDSVSTGPIKKQRTVIVSDGLVQWRELNAGRKVILRGEPTKLQVLGELKYRLEYGEGRIKGVETVLGYECVLIETIMARDGSRSEAIHWVSNEYGIVLRKVVQSDGVKTNMEVEVITINEPISPATFAYSSEDEVLPDSSPADPVKDGGSQP